VVDGEAEASGDEAHAAPGREAKAGQADDADRDRPLLGRQRVEQGAHRGPAAYDDGVAVCRGVVHARGQVDHDGAVRYAVRAQPAPAHRHRTPGLLRDLHDRRHVGR
jgi:hypothetical protein